ncbi:uncharacterized protein AB675_3152 [Cyphellophora attinorum]|uniref:Uncharacterized protein n=1 Tax=Cyphellophora attinorum TaxID=1664694 RepID=A0A0N0NKC6_9EURO|nr:uncharacterized protein AB675_3152 [Phialophora attinorum]KPI37878.1 hypothetical protein AB675_3152 [Phialophora attinorum]
MATLSAARQPFGVLNDSKLRHLQSVKNTQNSIPSPSLKRRAPSPDNSDSENVDPRSFDLKRKRTSLDNDVTFPKPARYSLSNTPLRGPRVLPATPRLDTVAKNTTPVSAPAAAGRSPTRKRTGFKPGRFNAPISTKAPLLSITAALQGTLANKKAKVQVIMFFDIYEEPEHAQNDRINDWTISQSADNLLDISDDEGKNNQSNDRGKENIDPNGPSVPMTRSMAAARAASEELKKDIMADDRAPLGELETVKYYSEGLDATSVVLVQDDDASEEKSSVEVEGVASKAEFTFDAGKALPTDFDTTDIAAVIKSSAPLFDTTVTAVAKADTSNDIPRLEPGEDLEIWESESAKDENERAEASESVFALQEL